MKKTLTLVLILVLALNSFAALGSSDTTLIRECVASASFNSLLISYCSAAIFPILIVNKILLEEGTSPFRDARKHRKDTETRPRTPFICGELIKFEKQCGSGPVMYGEQGRSSELSPAFLWMMAGRGRETVPIPVLFFLLYCIVLSLSNLPASYPVLARFPTVPIRSFRVGAFLFGGIA